MKHPRCACGSSLPARYILPGWDPPRLVCRICWKIRASFEFGRNAEKLVAHTRRVRGAS